MGLGAVSVTYQDGADQPVLEPGVGETPLWSQLTLSALFDADTDVEALKNNTAQQGSFPLQDIRVEILEDKDWEREWMQNYQAMSFGKRLWICPSWQEPPNPDAANLLLDPGLAFGTGTHPTTAMCLEWLDGAELSGKTVLDFGCGTGVLAIAALLLDAEQAVGVDNDPQALIAAQDNAQRNRCGERFDVLSSEDFESTHWDLVLANILAGPLVELSELLLSSLKPGGDLLLSGILEEQAAQVMAAYEEQIEFKKTELKEGWVCLHGVKRLV